jgi:uncharacterized protein (UPF0371 family)
MLDAYHQVAYGEAAVSYNRDMEAFPVLLDMFKHILGSSPYKSPTDMGVNMIRHCITDEAAVGKAAKQEIVRRYYEALSQWRQGFGESEAVGRVEGLMAKAGVSAESRPVVAKSLERSRQTGGEPAVAIELPDGQIVTGKTTGLLGAASAALLNSLKALGNIPKKVKLISPGIIEPIQHLKTNHMGNSNPRLHIDEILIALTICAADKDNPHAETAMEQLEKLKGCEAHSTVLLSRIDEQTFQRLGMNLTCEPRYQTKKLYHK